MRLLWACGPGNVISSYRTWRAGEDAASEVSITFSGQFFDFCKRADVQSYVIGWNQHADRIADGRLVIEHRPKPLWGGKGIRYHLSQLSYGLRLMVSALAYKADAVIADSGATYYFLLSPLRLLGIHIIPCLHNAVWPTGFYPKGWAKRANLGLDGIFWRWFASATICVSPEQQRQLLELSGTPKGEIVQMRGMFRRGYLDLLPSALEHPPWPFRILYAGRIERDKGIFDLLEIVARLTARYPGRIECKFCGDGSDLPKLREAASNSPVAASVQVLGRLDRHQMADAYGWCHVVVIPTRSGSGEGLPLVAQEAVLASRPFVTSPLSNTLDVLGEAAVEAQPDDLDSYVRALESLITDRELYASKCAACGQLQQQFYDSQNGFDAALVRALKSLGFELAPVPQSNAAEPVAKV